MGFRSRVVWLTGLVWLGRAGVACAGMPSITLTDIARLRIQAISFFLACFLASAWVIQRVWNSLRVDAPRLPRLTYGKAVGVVTLWGLLFSLVLTMISGARELMTPGAWRKEGFTFKLEAGPRPPAQPEPEPALESERRHRLDRLRVALWTYARGHDGRFPADGQAGEIPDEVWRVPDASGMRYLYAGGQRADQGERPLAYEPGLFGKDRLVLMTDGTIRTMIPEDLRRATGGEGPP